MKGDEMLDKIAGIAPAYIEAASVAPKAGKKRILLRRCGIIAACFVLLLLVGCGTYAVKEEAKEYNAALEFFSQYKLSTEGLTRAEIKKVYRDITTESFSYDKTFEVVMDSMTTEQIAGAEILQEKITQEDFKAILNYRKHMGYYPYTERGIQYRYRYTHKIIGNTYYTDKLYLQKCDGDEVIWSTDMTENKNGVDGCTAVTGGVIVFGEKSENYHFKYAWIEKYDENGKFVWRKRLNYNLDKVYVSQILEDDDGNYVVISRGDSTTLCFGRYSPDGEELYVNKNEMGQYGIWKSAHFGDGYVIQLGSHIGTTGGEYSKIAMLDHDGNITDTFSYDSDNYKYYIEEMMEFNGKLYISGYSVPKLKDHDQSGAWGEIYGVLHSFYEEGMFLEIPEDKLTERLQENYTAILLVCDPNDGTPKEFYSVRGSLGGKLSKKGSESLMWDVKGIMAAEHSFATSSYTVKGTSFVFRYTFDAAGTLQSSEKTGEIVSFIK